MSEVLKFGHYIGGQSCPPASGRWFPTYNPYTGRVWAQVAVGDAQDVDRAVNAAHAAFRDPSWRTLSPSQRGLLLFRLADLVAAHAEELARAEVVDNGKLLAEMIAQMRYMPQWFRYYAGLADKVEGAVLPIDKPNMLNYTKYEPLGVIAAIVPWNSPLLLASWKLAPALAAGNTVVIKPSEFTSTSIHLLMKLVEQAGFPPGVVNVVSGTGAQAGVALVEHPLVAKVAFTGGETAGRAIAQAAGRKLITATLELGGKSAQIVFPDAQLDNAVKGIVGGIFAATGQTCVAGSRVLVHRSVASQVTDGVLNLARMARMGDPMSMDTEVGPITTQDQLDKVLAHVQGATAAGAELLLGGKRAQGSTVSDGWFMEPTVFAGVTPDMKIAQQETFGPVLSIIPFDDEEEAVQIANGTSYGLATGIWTSDLSRAHRLADRAESGMVWINTYRTSAPMSPFGGIKASGIGREGGASAILQFLQVKSIWVDLSGTYPSPFIMRL